MLRRIYGTLLAALIIGLAVGLSITSAQAAGNSSGKSGDTKKKSEKTEKKSEGRYKETQNIIRKSETPVGTPNTMQGTMPVMELRLGMRKLWEDHVFLTRNYIISAVAGLGDTEVVANRLMKNQDEIGNAVGMIYGDAAGKKLASLLRTHISIAAEVVTAAKANDRKALESANTKWETNANEIAAFLAGANPNWSKSELQSMLQQHLKFTTEEAVARIHKEWTTDISSYDKGLTHMLKFADMLTDGIVKQHPEKFTKMM